MVKRVPELDYDVVKPLNWEKILLWYNRTLLVFKVVLFVVIIFTLFFGLFNFLYGNVLFK